MIGVDVRSLRYRDPVPEGIYISAPLLVRIGWLDGSVGPLRAICECEVSRLLPHAILALAIDVPEQLGWSEVIWQLFVRIDPGGLRFETWQEIEDQRWSSDYGWVTGSLTFVDDEPPWPTDQLSDALSGRDAEEVFRAFTRLRGGLVEFAGWATD